MRIKNASTPPPVWKECNRIVAAVLTLALMIAASVCLISQSNSTHEAVAATYPDHIVNGDFEYPGNAIGTHPHSTYISPLGYYLDCNNGTGWKSIDNWDFSLYGWRSTQTSFGTDANWLKYTPDGSELQRDSRGNTVAEIVAGQAGRAIYQDIQTTPGSVYKWSLDYQSHNSSFLDKMSVMIGSPSQQQAQPAWRTTTNGLGNVTGYVGTVLSTPTTRTTGWNLFAQSEHYEGTYICPEGQNVTRFSFKSVASQSETAGNKVDNITFIIADPLYYDSNGGTGNLPIPQPSGNYPGYYQRGTSITLSAVVPVREGYSFLGWTEAKHPDVTSASELSSIPTIKSKTIQAGSNYVYALWGKNPTITFKDPVTGMVISSVTIPFNALLPTTDVPDAPEHPGYVFRGFTPSTTGTFSSDTEIELVYEPQAIIKVNMKWVDLDDAMGNRPDIDLTIPSFTNPACTIPIHVDKTSSSSAAAFNPDVFVPPDTFALPDISPYAIRIHSCTEGTVDGIKTVTYEIRADYIPTEDVAVMKIWDDMSDAYGERPKSVTVNVYKRNPNVPADTEEPPDESAFWELYDTIEMLPAPEEATGDSNSWRYVLKDVPMWTATGHDGDVLIDAEYKVVEHDVYGYDTVSVTGSIEEGSFIITNRIWKHVDMPETGEHDVLFFYVSGVILLLASSIMIAIKREAIALN